MRLAGEWEFIGVKEHGKTKGKGESSWNPWSANGTVGSPRFAAEWKAD